MMFRPPSISSIDGRWMRSGRCSQGACFEWLELTDSCLLRDSKQLQQPNPPCIEMDRATWDSFKDFFAQIQLTSSTNAHVGSVRIHGRGEGWVDISDETSNTTLSFNAEEVIAFKAAVQTGDVVEVG